MDYNDKEERKELLNKYRQLLSACKPNIEDTNKQAIRKAFKLAVVAHKGMIRKSGEPYVYHPISVALIVAQDIGLGTTSIVCALLHDVVEDTDYTLSDIERMFDSKVAKIIDGLTKIPATFENKTIIQAENFRKMLLTLSDDVRVILIKLADRLHNMRTLQAMIPEKQIKIATETQFLYAPLAHRLGLYAIKSELEDLSMRYLETEVYDNISKKLKDSQVEREVFINQFIYPIKKTLKEAGFDFEIIGRTKSINSIWGKMQKKQIPFEEVYDLFAVRIIIDTKLENEKADCWRVYSIVTDFYKPNPDRLRDWISTPKANGYESLHTTVMSNTGKWVEVQIRTKRMDEIAEKGYAAHWKYKDTNTTENTLDDWLKKIRELLSSPESNASEFVDEFKMNLFSDEIFVFTPKGDLFSLPINSTALDFAYSIHSEIGHHCIGAKVNHKLVPISHTLKSGDQIEIISSAKQKPKEDWLNIVVTARAKSKIRASLKEEKRKIAEEGKELLDRKLKQLKLDNNTETITNLLHYFKLQSSQDLFYNIANGKITLRELKAYTQDGEKSKWLKYIRNTFIKSRPLRKKPDNTQTPSDSENTNDTIVLGDDMEKLNYTLAPCCSPKPGDQIFGFVTINEGIKIHKSNCPNATQLIAKFDYRIIKAKWTSKESLEFLTGIHLIGNDKIGILKLITDIISDEFKVSIQSINFDTENELFNGIIMMYIKDNQQLNEIINKIKKIDGIQKINKISRQLLE